MDQLADCRRPGMRERPDILVVEDEPAMADAMLRVLDIGGYAPRRVANGLQALRAAAQRRPELVLLDILMPVMDGWQCARELRLRYGNSLPIVVVTAAEHAQARAAELGADDVLAKPFEMPVLLEVVARYTTDGRPEAT
jgi:two-component system, OmpR family, response regulator MprA